MEERPGEMTDNIQTEVPKPLRLIDNTLEQIDWGKVRKETFDMVEHIRARLLKMFNPWLITADEIDRASRSMVAIYEPELSAMFALQRKYCTQCGECCRRCSPIEVTLDEVHQIANHLNISPKRLRNKVKGKTDKKGSLHIRGHPCPFLKGDDCSIYQVRPGVCKAFPIGYAITCVIIRKENHEMPGYCHALKEMRISIAVSRLLNDMLYRERPDLAIEMSAKARDMIEKSLSASELKALSEEGHSSSDRFAALLHLMTENLNRYQ